jgi:hypothetical protein
VNPLNYSCFPARESSRAAKQQMDSRHQEIATFLRKHGIADNFARKQMRHQTIRQTDGYTDEARFPIYNAINHLPRLGYTQIRAQFLGQRGQNVTHAIAMGEGGKYTPDRC